MSGINTGKVLTGGLLAGIVFNVIDFVANTTLLANDFRANATRLGLDPALMESGSAIATWVVIDFLLGILVVFTYAAMRPRFGPGPKTALYAALTLYLAITLVLVGISQGGMIPGALLAKASLIALINTCLGAVVGAWAYKEA